MANTYFWLLLIIILKANAETQFPKILWVYWEDGIENAPFITQLCVQNIGRVANNSGWKINILSRKNVMDYIQDKQRFESIHKNAKVTMGLQKQADVIRLFLIYNFGGIWMDANIFFIDQTLSWIQNINKFPYVTNKHGNHPDVLLFTLGGIQGDTRIALVDETQNQKIQLTPGNEVWFIAAKPKAKLIRDWLAEFELFIISGFKQVKQKNKKEGTIISQWSENFGDYLLANRAIESTLQVKQKQLDRSRKEGQQRQFAVRNYNLWSIDSGYTGYAMHNRAHWNDPVIIRYLMQKTVEEVNLMSQGYCFLKMASGLYNRINYMIDPQTLSKPEHFIQKVIALEDANPMTCTDIQLPQNYIVKDSFIQTYLLRNSTNQKVKRIKIFYQKQIRQKCQPETGYSFMVQILKILLKSFVLLQVLFLCMFIYECCKRKKTISFEI